MGRAVGGFYGTGSAREFFFTVTCACARRGRWQGVLGATALVMCVPSALLLRQGSHVVGGLSGLLALTSLAYHWNHNPWLRALDTCAVVGTSVSGLLRCVHAIATTGFSGWFAACLAGAALLNAINAMEFSRERRADGSATKTIALRWHVAVHMVTATTLVLLAMGLEAG